MSIDFRPLCTALLVASCRPEPEPKPSVDLSDRVFVPSTPRKMDCRIEDDLPRPFANVEGWGPFRWASAVDEVDAALVAANIPFTRKTFHKTGQDYFVIDVCGWEGTVYTEWRDTAAGARTERISQILFRSRDLASEAEAEATVAATREAFGPPQSSKPGYRDERRDDTDHVWVADRAKLHVTVVRYRSPDKPVHWVVLKALTPMPEP